MMRGRAFTGAVALVLVAAVWTWLRAVSSQQSLGPPLDRPIQQTGDGYVSASECRACHPAQYQSWHTSFHRTMTQEATPGTVKAKFDGVTISLANEKIELRRDRDRFWAEFDDPEATAGGARRRITREVALVTGSHQQQVYWYATGHGRALGQLPALYLIQEQRWIPRAAAFLRPPADRVSDETGRWNAVCVNCHTTHGKRRLAQRATATGSEGADTTVDDFGIACEACHGPGQEHVRANGNVLRRYRLHLFGDADPTIVQPERLDPRRASQACGQCHSVWDYYTAADERRANADGFPYRPGDDLTATRFVVQPRAPGAAAPRLQQLLRAYPQFVLDSFWADGQIRVSGREYNGLIDSPCYKNASTADRTLTCFSCHAMHTAADADPPSQATWADTHQVRDGSAGNGACLTCHGMSAAGVSAHTRHAAQSSGSSCYNCHMPYTTYGLLRGLRSHTITSPTVAESVQVGRPNACNLCHSDKPLGWTAEYLERWYGIASPPLSDAQRTVAASLLWLLQGDAGQRALAAWSLSWPPALAASGRSWQTPFLALLLNDPYDAVRIIAARSLRTLSASVDIDPMAAGAARLQASQAVAAEWLRTGHAPHDRALLAKGDGSLDVEAITRLMDRRDDRRVNLRE